MTMYSAKILRLFLTGILCFALAACSSTGKRKAGDEGGYNGSMGAASGSMMSYTDVAAMKQQLAKEDTVYFAFDRSEIKPVYQDILQKHAYFLLANTSIRVMVEGHTDERGTPEYNVGLSERRAKAVENFLKAQGVSSKQIRTVAYGEEKPVDTSHNESAYAKNRRAVLVYED